MAELRIPKGRVKLPGGDFGIVRQPPAVADRIGAPERRRDPDQVMGSFKRGGKAKRTGVYRLHKGERIVKASTAKKLSGPKIAAAARQRPASRRQSAPGNIGKKTTPRQAATPKRVAKPIVRKPAPRRR
jgi:hypothetical protein